MASNSVEPVLPQRPLIFGVGLPRTGTTSLNEALNVLQIPSRHFPFEFWEHADFSATAKFRAFTDTPLYAMVPDLEHRFPNSLFILTTRPKGDWLASMNWLLSEGRRIWPWRKEYDTFNEAFFGSAAFDEGLYGETFDRFHEGFRAWAKVRDSRVLYLDMAQGFGFPELCLFLDEPIPNVPYPRSNEARAPSIRSRLSTTLHKVSPFASRVFNGLCRRLAPNSKSRS